MASKGDLQTAIVNWRRRAAQAQAMGLPSSVWQPLAQKDINNVVQGHTPMDNASVADAINAALGTSPIKDPKPSTGGIMDILGNVGSDVQGLVTGFIPGLAHYAVTIPQQAGDFVKLLEQDPATQQKYGMETSGGAGAFIRDMSRVPLFGPLIPGLHTAAAMTTDTGRKSLEQHPVSTLVDVLPLAKEAGIRLTPDLPAEAGTATEAFQKGKVVRGVARATADQLTKVPAIGKYFDRPQFNQWMLDMGIHPDVVDRLSRPLAEIKTQTLRDMKTFMEGDLYKSMKDLPAEDRRTLSDVAKDPGVNDANIKALGAQRPDLEGILYNVRRFNESVNRQLIASGDLAEVPDLATGKMHTFSTDEPVVKKFHKASQADNLLNRAIEKLKNIQETRTVREGKLKAHLGKVRKYLESDTEFGKRPNEPMTPDAIRKAATPLVEAFRDKNPLTTFGDGIFGVGMPVQALTAVLRDVKALSGEEGLLAKWDEAMSKGDFPQAKKLLTEIKRTFNHASWDRTPFAKGLRDHIGDLQKETIGLAKRMRSAGYTMKTIQTAIRDEKVALQRVASLRQLRDTHLQAYLDEFAQTPEAKFHPLLADKLRESASNAAMVKYAANADLLNRALDRIQNSSDFAELRDVLGVDEANALIKEVRQQWLDISRSGVDPIFQHNVDATRLDYITRPSVLQNRYYKPGVLKERVFNLGHSVHDVLASITDVSRQMISEGATKQFINDHLMGWMRNEHDLKMEVEKAITADMPRQAIHDVQALVKAEIDKHWVRFDPNTYGFSKYFPGTSAQNMMIPKGIERALSQLTGSEGIPAGGLYDKTMGLWKFSVLTTPRHLSHIALGGLTMGMLRDPMMLTHLGEALKIVRRDEEAYLAKISGNINDMNPYQIFSFAGGKTMGRMMAEAAGSPVRALNRFEDTIARTYKVASMLSHEAKGMDRDMAIREANKIFVDMNSMTPFERTVVRKALPFYGFARHLFRYLFTYPVDHPIRASILTNFANQENKDWNSGLPRSFQLLFFLGGQDAQGNVTGIDYRSIDPFRSFFNDFTLAGITSQLNPVAQFAAQQAGINVLSATPELYPGSHFDPYTGSMVADRPKNTFASLVETLIPETQSIDALIGVTDKYKNMARSNPLALRRALYTSLGIPFAPEQVNIPMETEITQQKRYSDASSAISKAIQSGDFTKAKRYGAVPIPSTFRRFFPGRVYASPADIERVYQALVSYYASQGMDGVSVHAIIPKAPRPRSGR